ncbi:hypothetical protein EPICR_100072 [Candidatus Desulfarcum epimagneticum]|uniref:Glycosyltransferase n=1 Tax=uncultured Desulfobacteraceae bacterium TaxID=218296 RepID=A0A484HCQ7_9BACT|nr:hypothetical protein EPICR_100072 [uncultured Desulfobacteraceae bacterium]
MSHNRPPILSVCVITYQHAGYIKQCLDGILMQETDFAFEICLGEDKSHDGTREICLKYAQNHPDQIRLFLRDRKNVIHVDGKPSTDRYNLIQTLKACGGQYIAMCEGDDYWTDPYKLQKQVDFLEKNPDYAICFHRVTTIKHGRVAKGYFPDKVPETTTIRDLIRLNYIHTASCVFRNHFNPHIPDILYESPLDDYALNLLNAQYGKIKRLDEKMAVYRLHGHSIHSSIPIKDKKLAVLHTYDKFIDYFSHDGELKRRLMESRWRLLRSFENDIFDSTLFIDAGKRFGPEERLVMANLSPADYIGPMTIRFDIPPRYKEIKSFRWDPAGKPCEVRILEISYEDSSGTAHHFSPRSISSNGTIQNGHPGDILFDTRDPMVFLDIGGRVKSISIRCFVKPHSSLSTTQKKIITRQASLLKAKEIRIQEIENSLAWRLSQKTLNFLERLFFMRPILSKAMAFDRWLKTRRDRPFFSRNDIINRFRSAPEKKQAGGFPESAGDGSILFVSHDARLAGAQKLLLHLIQWLVEHTQFRLKIICLEGGFLLNHFQRLAPTLVWEDFSRNFPSRSERKTELLEFCGGIDLIYGNTSASPAIYDELDFLKAPVLTHVHELEKTMRRIPKGVIKKMKRHTNAYITCSTPVFDYLKKNHYLDAKQAFTVFEFIDDYPFPDPPPPKPALRKSLGLKENACLVFGCGTLFWRKGTDLFIETALTLLQKGYDAFHFHWIGENRWDEQNPFGKSPSWKQLEKIIRDRGLAGHISFEGVKDDPRKYFSAGDLFLMTSREDPFPLVCLEAAQCGLPVICFDGAGGAPEFVENDAGFAVPFEDVDAMAGKVAYLMDNPDIRKKMGKRAREKALARHTVGTGVPHILECCRKVGNFKPRAESNSKKAVIVTHSTLETGAPQIIFNVARRLWEMDGIEIICFSLDEGPLLSRFQKYGEAWSVTNGKINGKGISISRHLKNSGAPPAFALVNTAGCGSVMPEIKKCGVPAAVLIHDYTRHFDPPYLKNMYNLSDHIVYSSSFMIEVNRRDFSFDLEKTSVIPQGLYKKEILTDDLPKLRKKRRKRLKISQNAFVVMGCGYIAPRKGVDLFVGAAIQTIAMAGGEHDIHFVWVGGEILNETPDTYTDFLKRDAANAGYEKRIHFAGHAERLSPWYAAADLFFLSSREDPFPTVVLEALAAGIPVIGIQNASGSTDLIQRAGGTLVGYHERDRIPAQIMEFVENPAIRMKAAATGRRIVENEFDFDDYVLKLKKMAVEKLSADPKIFVGPGDSKRL